MATSPQAQAAAFRIATPQELGFDPQDLRRKYAEERERRLAAHVRVHHRDAELTREPEHVVLLLAGELGAGGADRGEALRTGEPLPTGE